MDATAIVSVIAALVAAAVSVYTARANRHKVKAEAADAISDAAVQLVEPLRCENLALRAEVQKLRAEVQKLRDDVTALQRENEALRDDVEALTAQIKSLGHTPVRVNSRKAEVTAANRGIGAKSES